MKLHTKRIILDLDPISHATIKSMAALSHLTIKRLLLKLVAEHIRHEALLKNPKE